MCFVELLATIFDGDDAPRATSAMSNASAASAQPTAADCAALPEDSARRGCVVALSFLRQLGTQHPAGNRDGRDPAEGGGDERSSDGGGDGGGDAGVAGGAGGGVGGGAGGGAEVTAQPSPVDGPPPPPADQQA
mmetsp:Transcript_49228/g.136503  ORF Transcript_49228/g.136503 Transcript_49228/m.136503 type:complete len:134 (-) Transcript_49228:208-609(-)